MRYLFLFGIFVASSLHALEAQLTVTVPSIEVAEYHRPYMAVWLADEQGAVVEQLAVWYDTKQANEKGQEWLKDLRQWWRKSGRNLSLPVDNVSGATKAVGVHTLNNAYVQSLFNTLKAGSYQLMVEAAREKGGREMLKLAFTLPVDKETLLQVTGQSELGLVQLLLNP